MLNFIFSASEYVPAKSPYTSVRGLLNVAEDLTNSLPQPAFHKYAPFMHRTRSSYRPFTDPGALDLLFSLFSLFPAPRLLKSLLFFSLPFSTIFLSVI